MRRIRAKGSETQGYGYKVSRFKPYVYRGTLTLALDEESQNGERPAILPKKKTRAERKKYTRATPVPQSVLESSAVFYGWRRD